MSSNKIDILALIRKAHPNATPAEIQAAIDDPDFLKAAAKLPRWSTLDIPQIQTIKTATVGSFIVAYGYETDAMASKNKEPLVAIAKRGDKGPNGEDRFGVLGGYTDLGGNHTGGEQPNQGAIRELSEEARNDKGHPIITPPDPNRLQPLFSMIDYRKPELPVASFGFAMKLTAPEFVLMKDHANKLSSNEQYRERVQKATGGEVRDIQMMKLSEVLSMPKESFTHPHEFDAVMELSQQLKKESIALRR